MSDPDDPRRLDHLCDLFESDWLAGRPPDLAAVVAGEPPATRPTLFQELLRLEREYRSRAGTPLTAAAARDRYTGLGPWAVAVVEAVFGTHRPVVPGFRLADELGRGTMGTVYRAAREADGAEVAVKVLHPAAPADVARFLREADILRRLDHPAVVRFLNTGAAGGRPYLVLEYVPGSDAGRLFAATGPVPSDRLSLWAGQVLDALAHAHDRGFVHRDVKPANLLVAHPGPGEVVKLADFGLARTYEASGLSGPTGTGVAGGTPAFIPPEQVTDFRNVGPAADQYGLAATLHYLLTGAPLYEPAGSAADLLRQVTTEDPAPLRPGAPELPGPFGPVIRRALARDPRARFRDARAMRQALLGP